MKWDSPGHRAASVQRDGQVRRSYGLAVGVVELGTNSEVGTLRVAILHRPGAELRRLNPQNNDQLLFDGLPWVARAQEEHDHSRSYCVPAAWRCCCCPTC